MDEIILDKNSGIDEIKENEIYSITYVADLFKLDQQTIRKYENDFELVIPRDHAGRRYYTQKEINVLDFIIKLKKDDNKKERIKKILSGTNGAIDQRVSAMELLSVNQMTLGDLKEAFFMAIAEATQIREEAMLEEFKSFVGEMREMITEEVRMEFKRQEEQRKAENSALLNYLEEQRNKEKEEEQKKGFLKRLFGSK